MEKVFLIYIDSFDYTSGGQVAMHKLCHDIRQLGYEAYITSEQTHPKLNTVFVGDKRLSKKNCVVIYPEIVHGNPLNANYVVRWVLNTPGVCGGVGEGFYNNLNDKDLIYKYSPFFEYKGKVDGILRCSFIDYDIFTNRHITRDIDECFLIKKGGMQKQLHTNNAVNLANFQHDWHRAAELFNRCKRFYCYDNECFWVTLAALCGCVSVVIPNTTLESVSWKEHFPYNKCGVAFGLEEVKHAEETIRDVYNNCIKCQQSDLELVQAMINKCNVL